MGEAVDLSIHVGYDKGKENFREAVVDTVRPISEMDGVNKYYFFWQEYSEEFERHLELYLITDDSSDINRIRKRVEQFLEDENKEYYWQDKFISTWWGLNHTENKLLLEARCKNSELALKTLEEHEKENLGHRPEELVNRNYHLTANMHGMSYWDELKFCFKRPVEMICAKVLPDRLYNKLFLRRETENF